MWIALVSVVASFACGPEGEMAKLERCPIRERWARGHLIDARMKSLPIAPCL
jgi:hypothetical protein